MTTYVCVIEAHLHFGELHDLKGKRKVLHSLKAQLRQRYGATVAEVDHHDAWQRSTLIVAIVGDSTVQSRGDELEKHMARHCPEGCWFERNVLTLEDLRGL